MSYKIKRIENYLNGNRTDIYDIDDDFDEYCDDMIDEYRDDSSGCVEVTWQLLDENGKVIKERGAFLL